MVTRELRAVPDPAADRQHGARDERASAVSPGSPDKGAHVGVMQRDGVGQRHPLVPRRRLLRLPPHERLGGRRQHRRRRDAARGAAAVPRRRRQADRAREADRAGWRAGPSTWPTAATPSRASSSTTCRASSRASTTAAPASSTGTAGSPAATARGLGGAFNSIAHVDNTTGKRKLYELPAGDATSEPVFVPRAADAAEGDGWLLATVWRAAREPQRSRGVQCHRGRPRTGCNGGTCEPRAVRLARQLGADGSLSAD